MGQAQLLQKKRGRVWYEIRTLPRAESWVGWLCLPAWEHGLCRHEAKKLIAGYVICQSCVWLEIFSCADDLCDGILCVVLPSVSSDPSDEWWRHQVCVCETTIIGFIKAGWQWWVGNCVKWHGEFLHQLHSSPLYLCGGCSNGVLIASSSPSLVSTSPTTVKESRTIWRGCSTKLCGCLITWSWWGHDVEADLWYWQVQRKHEVYHLYLLSYTVISWLLSSIWQFGCLMC